MGAANQCQVTLLANAIKVQREPIASNTFETYPYAHITGVVGVTFQTKASVQAIDKANWKYRFDTITIIEIGLSDGRYLPLELQEITNQATWNLGTLAALNQAITDINAVIP